MAKTNGNNLPAYTTVENILLLLDVLKRKTKEDDVKAIFGKGGSAYTNTKSALRTFGFIENDSLELTDKGRRVVYSEEVDRKKEIQKVLVSYPPYEVFLLNLLQKENFSVTEVDEIINFWGKANNGSTERNREDGAKLFMSIVDYLELGRTVRGSRGGNATRIEWKEDVKGRIRDMLDSQNILDVPVEIKENESQEIIVVEQGVNDDILPDSSVQNALRDESVKLRHANVVGNPHITINVDMSDWNEEKIKLFFKYAYGQFEKE